MRMDQLSAQFQLALADAQSLAIGHDNQVIEPTHLMVALLDQSGGIVRHLLAKIDVSLHRLRSTLCESMDRLPKAFDVESGDVPIGNDLNTLMHYTETVAKQRGEKHISSEIFVLAAIRDQGVLGTILAEAGLTQDRIELAITAMRGGQGINDQKAEVQGQARDSRTASRPERSKLEPVIGELRELANAVESDVLRAAHTAHEAAVEAERRVESAAERRNQVARWAATESPYRQVSEGEVAPNPELDIQKLMAEVGKTPEKTPRIPFLEALVTKLSEKNNELSRIAEPNVELLYYGWAAAVFFFVVLLLGQLADFFKVVGVLGTFILCIIPIMQQMSRADVRRNRQTLEMDIEALRGSIGWCLVRWQAESRQIGVQQCQQAREERQRVEAALVARFAPLALGLLDEAAVFGSSTCFIGADWDDPQWGDWTPAKAAASALRLGALTFHDPQVTALLKPVADSLSFVLPALVSLHNGSGVLFSTSVTGHSRVIGAIQSMVARLLATMRPGRLYLTFIDPVGLGNNISMFMVLRDYLDRLVNTRAWSEPDDIEKRLGELAERVEDIIQRRIPDPADSIEDYNARAGDLAEPYRVLVVLDFPRNFTDTAARRLASIAHNGPRCGVYPIVVRMQGQELPYRFDIGELERSMVCIDEAEGRFVWRDDLFAKGELALDPPAPAELISRVIAAFGEPAKEAENVEIPFSRLLTIDGLTPDGYWTHNSMAGIRIPLGVDGNGKLVSLAIHKEEKDSDSAYNALLAGAVGMGKSNLLHVIVSGGVLAYAPDELELYLIDLKAGVEFNTYSELSLPHAKAIVIDSDPEYGLSVLDWLVNEMDRRLKLFTKAGVQDLLDYRKLTKLKLARILLIIDEFQVLFPSDSGATANRASAMLESLARLGRSPGIHVLLCSQSIGRGESINSQTADQMRIRIALGCSEAEARRVLADDNLVPSRFTRKGQALYNPNLGMKDSNREFQVALFSNEDKKRLRQVIEARRQLSHTSPVVFVGSDPAHLPECVPLATLLAAGSWPQSGDGIDAWLGEPIAMRPPIAARLLPEGGSHLLAVSRDEGQAVGLMIAAMLSIAAKRGPEHAAFLVLDLTRADTAWANQSQTLAAGLPHPVQVGSSRHLADQLTTLDALLDERIAADRALPLHVYWVILGLHKARALQEGDGYSSPDAGSPQAQFLKLLRQGPELGMHVLAWCDSVRNLQTVGRSAVAEFRLRVAGPMDDGDSAQLIDSTAAARLKPNRLVFVHKDEPESMLPFRPYALPDTDWLTTTMATLKQRPH